MPDWLSNQCSKHTLPSIKHITCTCHCCNHYSPLYPVPDGPPRDVNTTALSSTELHVSWNEVPEIDRNGIITMYEVMYEPLMTFDGQLQTLNVTTNSTSINLNGLQEYVNYNISVRAYTSEGPGNYSEEVTTRTLEDGND